MHNWSLPGRAFSGGTIGVAESYIDGDWESPDVTAFLELFVVNREAGEQRGRRRQLAGQHHPAHPPLAERQHAAAARAATSRPTTILATPSTRNGSIPSMTYSSALFADGANDLEGAQAAKYRALARDTGIGPSDHVLEIGCGWGGFAEFAAREIGCRVTGLTISKEQHDFARERIAKAGLADKVEIKLQDYRDETGTYDRIASIEMFEAVGEKYWPVFFGKVKDCLKAGGTAGMQIITINESAFQIYRKRPDFIQRYVFPGRHAADAGDPQIARRRSRPVALCASASSRRTMRARLPNGASASGRHGKRSCRSASTSASSGCGNSISTIARRASAPSTSTSGR